MSGFLKFIVHLVVFLSIICILALAVPPFVGISTVIIDDADKETNLPLGSVTYGKDIAGREVLIGDSIIVQDGNQIYRYRVQEIDLDNSLFTVLDTSRTGAEPKAITLRGNITKVTITIGFIGYLLMAIQSTEGLVIIGLGVLFLIILFVLAELWSKDKDSEPDPSEQGQKPGEEQKDDVAAANEGVQGQKSKRQLKKEARARQKAEVARLKQEAKERRREEKEKLKAAKKIARTGGFIEDMEPVETILGLEGGSPAEQAADQAHEELRKEIEAATVSTQSAEMEKMPTAEIPDLGKESVSAQPEPTKQEDAEEIEVKQAPETAKAEEEAEPKEADIKIAIPLYTAEELLEKAKAAGEAPKVIQDEDTGVTLLDYSSIIGGGNGEGE